MRKHSMRLTYQHFARIRQIIESITAFLPKAKVFITLGLEGRQWLACALICAMLLPVFSLPVSAVVGFNGGENTGQFEPVNEQLPIWTRAWRNLNVRLELWSASLRNEGLFGNDEN